jgi:2-amino-4-hydroxy-6-hydroxymethyldihydropteridine diphosphokinase
MPMSIIALGANLPGRYASPAEAVEAGLRAIASGAVRLKARSRLYRSAAWPDPADPEFVNAVAVYETDMGPAALLDYLHAIEAAFGRTRREANAPRPLDLDIIDYDGMVSAPGERPDLPHPRLGERAFVLLPLADVSPVWRHPVSGLGVAELIATLPETSVATPL